MREIKFRAWSKSENLMGEVTGFRFSKSQYPFVNARFRKNGKTVDEGYHFGQEDGCDSVILMQFTGLYDKNGVEIYEGDIVEYRDLSGIKGKGVVKFENGSFCIDDGFIKAFRWIDYEVEKISNVFDNPELLEDGKER